MAVTVKTLSWGSVDVEKAIKHDFHVLRGNSSMRLDESALAVEYEEGGTVKAEWARRFVNNQAGYTLEFSVGFKGTVSGSNIFDGGNTKVSVNTDTGQVFADAAGPSLGYELYNFIMTAKLTGGGKEWTKKVRFHLHNSVSRAWLTPPNLTLREGISNHKLTLLIEFDDGTVHNITNFSGVYWSSDDPSAVTVSSDTGELSVVASGGGAVTIRAKLPADLGGADATPATVTPEAPWPASHPVELVPTSTGPGFNDRDKAMNLLFLGDGFENTATGKNLFDRYVRDIVDELNTNDIFQPYKDLAGKINYWQAFVPSPEAGGNILNHVAYELNTIKGAPYHLGTSIERAMEKPSAGAWRIEHMLHEVGMPVPTDKMELPADLETRWKNTLDPDPTPNLTAALISDWQDLAEYCIPNEVDTTFGLSFGDPPSMEADSDPRSMGFHPHRYQRQQLDTFIRTLEYTPPGGAATNVGDLWVENGGVKPRDYDRVVMINAGVRYGGKKTANADDGSRTDLIAASMRTDNRVNLKQIGGNVDFNIELDLPIGMAIAPKPLAPIQQIATVAHEIVHSLGLDDEYGEISGDFPDLFKDFVRKEGNLQLEEDLTAGGGMFAAADTIDRDKIKWMWHRIKAAGIVAGAVGGPDAGGGYEVPLEDGAGAFAAGDAAFFRFRDPNQVITANPMISNELTVVSQSGNTVKFSVVGGGNIEAHENGTVHSPGEGKFTPGSILFAAVPATASEQAVDASLRFERLMAVNIRDHLHGKSSMLNADCAADTGTPQMPVLPGGLIAAGYYTGPNLVGLFSGGATYACHIYHPTGSCLMRSLDNGISARELCPVCQYILVEWLDPNQHGKVKARNDRYYPIDHG